MASDGLGILDLVAESVVVQDLEGRIQAWNTASQTLYGIGRTEAVGRISQDLLKTEYPAPIADVERAVLTTGAWEGEVRRTSGQGAAMTILARWALRRDGEGKPIAIVETGRSVTRSKEFDKLEASERRYRDLFHYMPIGLTQVDASRIVPLFKELRAQGVTDLKAYIDEHPDFLPRAVDAMLVEEVNEQNVRIFGAQTAAEMLGPVTRYFKAAMPTIRRSIEARYSGVEFFQEEMKATRMDGSVVDVLFATARPGAIADKSLVGFIDITARKKSEEGLRQSEYRYRNMFQAMAASFWELDFSGANELVRDLMKSGVTDLRQHFQADPAFVRQMMKRTRVVDVNDQTVALFGRGDRQELLGNVDFFWPEESTQVYAEAYARAAEGAPNYSAECRFRRIDGSLFDGLFTVAYPPKEMGRGTTMVGVIDITARKQSEAALRASERRYQNLFQAMAVSFWEVDFTGVRDLLRRARASGVSDFRTHLRENPEELREMMRATRVVDVNDRTVTLFGRGAKEDLLGTTEPIWPEESWPDYIEAIIASIENRPSFSIETRLRRLDGTIFDAQFTAWHSPDNRMAGLAGVIDVTERKQAHAELERSNERYRQLFHNLPIPLFQMDVSVLLAFMSELRAQGVTDIARHFDANPDALTRAMKSSRIAEVNNSAVQLFGGREPSDLIGSIVPFWIDNTASLRRIYASRFNGEESYREETKVRTIDGRVLEGLFTSTFSPALTEMGISLNSFVDATEKNRAEAMLQRVQADFAHAARVSMLGELTASIAHEVNQPLAAIAANGEAGLRWLARPEPDVVEVRELTKRIVADARRAADVISRIRDMAVRRAPVHTPLSIDEVIREALLFLRHEVQARGVLITYRPATKIPHVRADRTQLQQVIVNLAVNGMQAMAQSTEGNRSILIRTAMQDDTSMSCSIEDSGPGIDASGLARLFDSFFTTKEGGMGMGLPICRSIIEAHGGRISGDNNSSIGGARFMFSLPAAN